MPNPDIDIDTWIREIREHMKRIRVSRGLPQRQVAERMGNQQSRIAALEIGRGRRLDLGELVEWATAIDARITLTIEYDEQPPPGD